MKSFAVITVASLLVVTSGWAATDPALKCESIKIAAAGKKVAGVLKCHGKSLSSGDPVDPNCLTKANEKLASAFTKAEQNVACTDPGDQATVEGKVDAFTAAMLVALPPGMSGAACAGDKLGATGKKTNSLLKAVSKDTVKPDQTKLVESFSKAQDKFKGSFVKAEDQNPCQTTDDAAAIRLDIDDFINDLLNIPDPVCPQQLLYSTEGNRLRRYDIETIDNPPLIEDILVERASLDPINGRDVNGAICERPGVPGGFISGEDTGQPTPPPGWGVFDAAGMQVGKLTARYYDSPGEPKDCAFDSTGRLFTSTVGNQPVGFDGQVLLWFPPYDVYPGLPGEYPATNDPSTNYCQIAADIPVGGAIAIDPSDRVYVASSLGGHVRRYNPPFPTAPNAGGGCGGVDPLGSPTADAVNMEIFISDAANVGTPAGLARKPNGNWFVSSVLTGIIAEYDANGAFIQRVLQPEEGETTLPLSVGHPQALALDCAGNLYYADLALVNNGGDIGPGPGGTVRRITFDLAGLGREPEIVKGSLAFPDGLGIFAGDLE